jgi:hypothetical protein
MRVTVLPTVAERFKPEELFCRAGLNESVEVVFYRQVRLDTAAGLK